MTPPDLAALVRGLTEAQRRALIALADAGSNPYGWTPAELGAAHRTLNSLWEKGLATSSKVYGGPRSYLIQDKGLEIRQALPSDKARGE